MAPTNGCETCRHIKLQSKSEVCGGQQKQEPILHKKNHMIQHPPGTPPLSISCSNFSLSALDVMLSSLYLSLGFKGIKFATQKLNFSASEDDGLSPALATSSANLEWLFPTAMALDQQYKQYLNTSLLCRPKGGFWHAHITGTQDWQPFSRFAMTDALHALPQEQNCLKCIHS